MAASGRRPHRVRQNSVCQIANRPAPRMRAGTPVATSPTGIPVRRDAESTTSGKARANSSPMPA